jgi:hypothetical protein
MSDSRRLALLLVLACARCYPPPPGSQPDLAKPADLASGSTLCSGTTFAVPCIQAFFGDALTCFHPTGACMQEAHVGAGNAWCWADGSRFYAYYMSIDAGTSIQASWRATDGTACVTGEAVTTGTGTILTFHRNGATLVYDLMAGDITCPDSTVVHVGNPACGDIAVFDDNPPGCTNGTCPLP